jgi:hypothetical protein
MNNKWLNCLTTDKIENAEFPIKEVLSGSLFYPAAGIDGSPIRHWVIGVDSFIYVDALASKTDYLEKIKNNAFKGYGLLAQRVLTKPDLTPQGWLPMKPKSLETDSYNKCVADLMADNTGPFAIWAVFERLSDYSENHGPTRFSLLYIRGEACATYQALFVANRLLPRVICLIRPGTGFGGNFSNFEEVFLETMLMHKDGLAPQLLSWHEKNKPNSKNNCINDLYKYKVQGPYPKDGEPNFQISLFQRT